MLFVTSCAEGVRATVTETADEVHIDDITGDPIEGDCLGGFPLELDEPIGERTVVVDGEEWQRLQRAGCPDQLFFAPPGVELSLDCFPQ